MKLLYTEDQVLRAINKFQAHHYSGLCLAFCNSASNIDNYTEVPKFLKALGGRPRNDWFWTEPWYICFSNSDINKSKQARAQRATMLAFMLTWSQDPDFEV